MSEPLDYLRPSDWAVIDTDWDGKATDHPSSFHAGLNKSPKLNWVERVGGFPPGNWIYRAAKHLHADAGMTVGRAIATAINAARKGCATGDLNWPGHQSVNAASRGQMCAAVAQWEAMKAKAKTL